MLVTCAVGHLAPTERTPYLQTGYVVTIKIIYSAH